MKKTIIKILKDFITVIFILVVIDFIAGAFFKLTIDKSPDGRYFKTNYLFDNLKEEILIIGDSKAEGNYSPHIFEEYLQMECWNAGRGGQNIPYIRCVQEAVLDQHSPEVVIINIDKDNFEQELNYEEIAFLKPFYWDNPEIKPFIDSISENEKYFMYSNLYTFNSTFYYLFRSFFVKGSDGHRKDKGWKPKFGQINISRYPNLEKIHYKPSKPLNMRTIEEFENAVSSFINAGSDVYVVISPDFQPRTRSITYTILTQLSKKHGFNFMDFSFDTSYIYKPELFSDFLHLNHEGARLFSEEIARRIMADRGLVYNQ